jgi:hypothetical protein
MNRDFEKWALPLLHKLQKVLLTEDFTPLTLHYGLENTRAYAECRCLYPYKSITINYGDEIVRDFKKGKRNDCLAALTHEMCHPITDPLYSKATSRYASKDEIEDERERLTDHIANIVLKNKLI